MKFLGQFYKEAMQYCRSNGCNVYTAYAPSFLDIKAIKNDKIAIYPSKFFFKKIDDLSSKSDVKSCSVESINKHLANKNLILPNPFTSKTGGHYSDQGYQLLSNYISECIK